MPGHRITITMVNTGHANQEFPYILLVALRRVFAALVTVASLGVVMWAFGVRLNESYVALTIIAALMALMLFSGKGPNTDVLPPRLWNISVSVISRWFVLIAALLLLGYATKTSSIFSRRALLTWIIVTPPLLVLAQLLVDVLISRMLLSVGNKRRVVIAGADHLGHKLASKIQSSPYLGMKIDGFFDDRGEERLANTNGSTPCSGAGPNLPTSCSSICPAIRS